MLLENFISSGPSGSIPDGKSSVLSKAETMVNSNAEEFKKALNDSIIKNDKLVKNQNNIADNESSLLSDAEQLIKVDKTLEDTVIEVQESSDSTEIISGIVNLAINQNQNTNSNPATGKAANNGNLLPEGTQFTGNLNKTTNHTLSVKAVSENATTTDKVTLSTALNVNKTNQSSTNVLSDNLNKVQAELSSSKTKKMTATVLTADSTGTINKDKQPLAVKLQLPVINSSEISADKNNKTQTIQQLVQQTSQQNVQLTSQQTTQPINMQFQTTKETTGTGIELKVQQQTSKQPVDLIKASIVLPENLLKQEGANKNNETVKGNEGSKLPIAPAIIDKAALTVGSKEQTFSKEGEVIKSKQSVVVSEPSKQGEAQLLNLKSNAGVEQLVQQARRDDSIIKTFNNTLTSTEAVTQSVLRTNGYTVTDAVISQSQLTSPTPTITASRGSEVALAVSLPTPQWNQKFAEHVSMLALRGATNAQIRLNPPELGPLLVRIQHTGNETQVQFVVNNPIARDLVDSGLQRLREMLEQHGFENVDVDVNEYTDQDRTLSEEGSDESNSKQNMENTNLETEIISEQLMNNSLIDIYA